MLQTWGEEFAGDIYFPFQAGDVSTLRSRAGMN